jgi:hypothetical protein
MNSLIMNLSFENKVALVSWNVVGLSFAQLTASTASIACSLDFVYGCKVGVK